MPAIRLKARTKPLDVTSPEALPADKATIRYEITCEGGEKIGKGGTGVLFINDKKVAEGTISNTVPALFSADETADVAIDHHTPVTPDKNTRHPPKIR